MNYLHPSLTTAMLGLAAVFSSCQPAQTSLSKPAAETLRVMTWNVYRDSIFPADGQAVDVAGASRPAQFARILRAMQPDVMCLQQVTVGAQRSAALVDQILPLPGGERWQAHAAIDTVIISRFPLGARGEGRVEGGVRQRGHSIAIVESPDTDLYMICAHFHSSDSAEDVALRRQQASMVVDTIREAKAGSGEVPLRARTPFVILGDFNSIPDAATFIDAILSGDAPRTAVGQPAGLDWDGTVLTDALPHHNVSQPEVYTWRNDLERFPPSALDRVLYSDSVLTSVKQFVLDTTTMPHDELVDLGLRTIDVMLDPQAGIHDHFPLVIDLAVQKDSRPR